MAIWRNRFTAGALGTFLLAPAASAGGWIDGPGVCPHWSELFELAPPAAGTSIMTLSPLMADTAGDVWAFLLDRRIADDRLSKQLVYRRSQGHSGQWDPLLVAWSTVENVFQAHGVIDAQDVITFVFRLQEAEHRLDAIRYVPGEGWGDAAPIFTTDQWFQFVRVAADDEGNVIVIIDPFWGGGSSVASFHRDASSGLWTAPVTLTAGGLNAEFPTLACSDDRETIWLAYLVREGSPSGLYAHRWDSQTRTWGAAQHLPATELAGDQATSSEGRFPFVVGGDGEATIFWQSTASSGGGDNYGYYVSRTVDGIWQPACELLAPAGNDEMVAYAHADAGDGADVMGVASRFEGAGVIIYAFRHGSSGWDPPATLHTTSFAVASPVRVGFYHGHRAVTAFVADLADSPTLSAMRYTGMDWMDDMVELPATHIPEELDMLIDGDEALVVYEKLSMDGFFASWLRTSIGDVNCDGVVGVLDLLEVIAAWGACPDPPPDCFADVDGSGEVDVLDLLTVIANWS